ncbi:spore cortex biosynthesis protein YabQ [Paenibacillus beijingensis]|uniref:Spore cortex biosynthesis protein YabQ n=1 Tax=Paenibacillus beijingensis TaxID=1126833 RepID=A0A0D5NIX4_9BACL|nr:spore cortex biosynthesis protein YabQ [Paenibacillus beijingensis]AJY74942.1 spore cortex biosynthesis protein YabQ [Paenibacillus beijingensis]
MSLNTQWWTMAMMLLSGLAMGAVFDGYRVISHELRFSRWLMPVLDLLYWGAATLTVFRVLYASNNGEVRAYVFLGLLIGIGFYFLLFSRAVMAVVRWSIEAVRRLIAFLLRCIDVLIVKPLILLYRLIRIIAGFLIVVTIFLSKLVLQLVRPLWLLARWLLSPLVRPLGVWLSRAAARLRLKETGMRIGRFLKRLWNKLF